MLQMTREKLYTYDEKTIQSLWQKTRNIIRYRQALHERVTRKKEPYEMMGECNRGKTIAPFEEEILGIGQGYLGGKEPIYTVRTNINDTEADAKRCKEYKLAIDDICRYNDCQALHLDLIGDFLETTAAYLYIYEEAGTNQIIHARFDPLCTVGIWDYSVPKNLIGVIRRWVEDDEKDVSREVIELITDQYRDIYKDTGNGIEKVDNEQLLWGDVPVVAFEKEGMTAIFEPSLTLIDAYEQIVNNVRNMTQYNDEAKLKITGYSPQHHYGESTSEDSKRQEEEKAFLESLVMFVGEGGDVSWILKNVDYSGLLNVEKTLQSLIMFCVASPDTTDTTFSAAESSLALRLKMFPFELRVAQVRSVFRKGYMRQIELETNRMNLKGAQYDFTRVNVELPVNVPSDAEKTVSMAMTMYNSGLFSKKTCIAKSGVDVDPDQEIKQRQMEVDEEYDRLIERNEKFQSENDDNFNAQRSDDGDEA